LEFGVEHQILVQLRAELALQWEIVSRFNFPFDHKESLKGFRLQRELKVANKKYNQMAALKIAEAKSQKIAQRSSHEESAVTTLLRTLLFKEKGQRSPGLSRGIPSSALLVSHANPALEAVTDECLDKRAGGVACSAKGQDDASVDSSVERTHAEVEEDRMRCRARKRAAPSELYFSDDESDDESVALKTNQMS
jgi:hypothetical protein